MRRGGLGVVLGIVAMASAPSASGAPAVVARLPYEPAAGPVLAGGQPVWAERSGRGLISVRTAADGDLKTLWTSKGLPPSDIESLSGSPQLLVVELVESDPAADKSNLTVRRRVFAGPAQGPLRQVAYSCGYSRAALFPATDASGPSAIALNDDATATGSTEGACQGVISDGSSATAIAQGPVQLLRLSADYAAWVEGLPLYEEHSGGSTLRVVARDGGATVTDLQPDQVPNILSGLALSDDGTAAVAWGPGTDSAGQRSWQTDGGLGVAPPGAATLHVLGRHDHYQPRFAGSQLAALRSPGADGPGQIEMFDSQGRVIRSVAPGALDDLIRPTFGFDGARLTWTVRGCGTAQILAATVAKSAQGAPPRCALALRRTPRLRGRHLVFAISCAGITPECSAAVTVRVAASKGPVARGVSRSGGAVDLRVASSAEHLLRRGTQLRIEAGLADDGGAVSDSSARTVRVVRVALR